MVLVSGILFTFAIIIVTIVDVVVAGVIWLRLVMGMLWDFGLVFGIWLEIYKV